MHLVPQLLTTALLATIPLACSGGGGGGVADLQAADLDGTWRVTTEVIASTCNTIGETEDVTLRFTVNGTTVTVRQVGESDILFELRGSRVLGTLREEGAGVRRTTTVDFGIVAGKLEGTLPSVQVDLATGQERCRETLRLTGVRQVAPPVQSFAGSWDLTLTVTSVSSPGGCATDVGAVETLAATIAVQGGSATLTPAGLAPILLDVVAGGLQATLSQVVGSLIATTRFDLALVTADSFDGTVASTFTDATGATVVCNETFRVAATRAPLLSAQSFAGTWDLTLTVDSVSSPVGCATNVGDASTIEVTIAVQGASATLTPVGQGPIPLVVVNGRLQGTLTQALGSLTATTLFDLGLLTADAFDGTVASTIQDGSGGAVVCDETFRVAATRAVL